MKSAPTGGCRIYNHRNFPNTLHAKLVKLKKETGKTIEFLIVAYLELALDLKVKPQAKLKSIEKKTKNFSEIENAGSWKLAHAMAEGPVEISEDLCMPYGIVAIGEVLE